MNNELSKDNEEKSENDISEITDQAIFQGAFSLLNKGISKTSKQTKNNHQYQDKQNHNDTSDEQTKPKILQNLAKMDQPIITSSNSMYSSGILSFRNKKAYFHNPQFNQSPNHKKEESIDQEAITQSILEKMNTIKKTKKTYTPSYPEDPNSKGKMANNESTKAYEEENEERDFKTFNTNSSDEQGNNDCNSNNSSYSNNKGNENEDEESNRIFWQVKKDKDSELFSKHKDNNSSHMTSGRKRKHQYLNKIVCTLSLLEKGKAIFVSQDDMIFVLPALFVPKNLTVGNTYVFKVREYEPFSFKSATIQDIQKKYKS